LNELSYNYINYGNNIQAKLYADSALTLAGKLNFKKGKAVAYRYTGIIYGSQGNNVEALKNYQAAIKIGEEIGDKKHHCTVFKKHWYYLRLPGKYFGIPKKLPRRFKNLRGDRG
jgi:tetratricopeptide (TPR) repeat protein